MKKNILSLFAVASVITFAESTFAQDHGHLNIGATGTNQNDQLTFDNGAVFATDVGYVKTLDFATSGKYTNYFQGNITFTGLAATTNHLGPEPNAPALGSQIHAQLVSVDGPPGGAFAFWETGATNPTFSVACGATGTNTWQVSENDGSLGADPYGHFHGRRFTATKAGIYTVGFRAFDYSTNGVSAGPIHTPSSVLKIYFQAGVNIKSLEPHNDRTRVTFGARAGYVWQVEATAFPASGTNWESIGTPLLGNDYFHEVEDDHVVEGHRYYRTKGTPYVP